MLCFGYYPEDDKKIVKSRFDKKYIVFSDKYERLTDEGLKDMYREMEGRFVSGNKFDAENMGQFHYAMKTGAEFSKEMARSVKEALKNWNGKKL